MLKRFSDTRLNDEACRHPLSLVHVFHRKTDRIERELDSNVAPKMGRKAAKLFDMALPPVSPSLL